MISRGHVMGTKFQHEVFGECELVRIEGVNWVMRLSDGGKMYRILPENRQDFTPVPINQLDSSAPPSTNSAASHTANTQGSSDIGGQLFSVFRRSNQSIELADNGTHKQSIPFAVPSTAQVLLDPERISKPVDLAPTSSDSDTPPSINGVKTEGNRRLRKFFESMANGLVSIDRDHRGFAVGNDEVQMNVRHFLGAVDEQGGSSILIRGSYGQGKTFNLQLMKHLALEAGFIVASTEIDSFENQLDKPHSVYRGLIQNLRFPDTGDNGALGLVQRTQEKLRSSMDAQSANGSSELISRLRRLAGTTNLSQAKLRAIAARQILEEQTQCRPLSWLLSDTSGSEKPTLVGLLACQPGLTPASGRRAHILDGTPRDWPSFSAGTQGDFGSYLLSGISRLSRFLGYRGLIIILDEMEKWQDLDWRAQSRAGNLLGGLIWAAGAPEGSRRCKTALHGCDHSGLLTHSVRCQGYPFSTVDRCHLGLAIAMTPRGDEGPELSWSNYGTIEILDLPHITPSLLDGYVRRVFPAYCLAYNIEHTMPAELPATAIQKWRLAGDGSMRSAVQSVLFVMEKWRRTIRSAEASA